MSELVTDENVALAKKILETHRLCDHCIGRMFGKAGHGYGNAERAGLLRDAAPPGSMPKAPIGECELCDGLLGEIDHFANLLVKKAEGYEYATFLVGSKIDESIVASENAIVSEFGLTEAEPVRMEVNREVGKRLFEITGKETDFDNADITFLLDTAYDEIKTDVRSLYIWGRYRKYVRDIPQTKWPCTVCRGRGCARCGNTGKLHPTSVEELLTAKAMDAACAQDESFHGAGREDIDALMLGNGRPCVMELKRPRIRTLDLAKLETGINEHAASRAGICGLRYSDKKEVVGIKDADYTKTYLARVVFSSPVNERKLNEALHALRARTIDQRTPSRVAHRRSDLVRRRTVLDIALLSLDGEKAEIEVTAESGTYIKELISGDGGRTQPSLSGLVGIGATVYELDVIAIND
ncbi:MAG: tRNA pseudouridine(54/55) synthase Pus10 [Thermoplasmata archaeon HGW-Thermoplasmata-1]|nr:MAG: tRNA pseudouridine(54/55) synthase Pus10 [Thermoplasmata archaeon HGW-Thermoplasmata-1]